MPRLPDVAIRRILMTADTVGGVWTYALNWHRRSRAMLSTSCWPPWGRHQ